MDLGAVARRLDGRALHRGPGGLSDRGAPHGPRSREGKRAGGDVAGDEAEAAEAVAVPSLGAEAGAPILAI